MHLSSEDRGLVIRALTKVLETEPPYARADEYKKLLEHLKSEQRDTNELPGLSDHVIDIDDV